MNEHRSSLHSSQFSLNSSQKIIKRANYEEGRAESLSPVHLKLSPSNHTSENLRKPRISRTVVAEDFFGSFANE